MTRIPESLQLADLKKTDFSNFSKQCADCVILTKDGKLMLQYRPPHWWTSPDCLNTFGGHVENGENALETVIRELQEETGGHAQKEDLAFLGALTEDWTDHTELVHLFFWHDRNGTITGCYEAESRFFDTAQTALEHPKLMDYARWAIEECRKRNLLE